ncbi:OmpA family protein [Hydrogenimonas urashimensis]|uniref:OmpA family protein n=1 Tax=Hydrogenimonas urashimensis TaxID=2740515 RepID=UPI001915CA69|nr:OmpA family protein [Hydrogenimonas urashimensis]
MKYLKLWAIFLVLLPLVTMAGGLVTGAEKYAKFESGDKILFRTDFRQCPVGEIPEGFDEIKGAVECVKYNDHIWVAPSAQAPFSLLKKIDLGREDFSIEFTVMRYQGGGDFYFEMLTKDKDKMKSVGPKLYYAMQYCEIHLKGIGQLAMIRPCEKKPMHFAIQVRRHQMRLYLNGKRLTSIPWKVKENETVQGFLLSRRGGYAPKPYDTLITDIKVAKYTKKEAKPTPEKLGISVQKTKEGMKLTVPAKVLFDFNKFILKPEAKKALSLLGDIIRENPAKKIVVTGYTDNVGSDTYNLKLSLQRAQSVADYLIYCEKVNPELFKIEGKGKANPVASNATEEGRAKNRRVEIRLIK